jgi:hypothetical protein
MKLLQLDSSLRARKKLAQELGYRGKLAGSAEMNIWLHKHVMQIETLEGTNHERDQGYLSQCGGCRGGGDDYTGGCATGTEAQHPCHLRR